MARYTGPVCKLCRREGVKLFLKGERCMTAKCAVTRRQSAPGQHGKARVRVKEYGTQMREKQKAKRYYGVLEKQFRSYFKTANKKQGVTGENLLTLLERRLDNTVYKMGMAESRREARQLILHGHFRLNGKKVTIPSILVKTGDIITLREASRGNAKIKALMDGMKNRINPRWLEVDKTGIIAKVAAYPTREDVDFPFQEQLIVELYSR